MRKNSVKGAITVFLSLLSVLFLALISTLAESARVPGARARAAAVTDIGLFSVFSEYERDVMEQFQLFVLDGAYGSGDFSQDRIALRLRHFIGKNIEPEQPQFGRNTWQMFPLRLERVGVSRFAVATDENGAVFYQQVVRNTKAGLGIDIVTEYLNNWQEAAAQDEKAKDYQQREEQVEQELAEVETAEPEADESERAEGETEAAAETEKTENPLDSVNELKKKGILELVVKDPRQLSTKTVDKSKLVSGRKRNQGNLEITRKEQGAAADAIFYEYLQRQLSCATKARAAGELDYQLEYVLIGKNSDVENLKAVVHRLLVLREGVNFAVAMSSSEMRGQADVLATAIAASLGLPLLGKPLGVALVLGWAYGESLLDVRILLAGGKVALNKSRADWQLSLENLGRLGAVLEECDKGQGRGQTYQDYLRILYFLGAKASYPLRALDVIEGLQRQRGYPRARADHWVTAAEITADWYLEPVFLGIPAAFMDINETGSSYSVTGGFAY